MWSTVKYLISGRIAAADGRYNRTRQVAPMCPHGRAHWRQTVIRSVQPFLHSSRQSVVGYIGVTWRIRLKLCFLRPTQDHSLMANRSVQPFCAQLRAESPYTLQWAPFPQNCPFPWGIRTPSILFIITWASTSPQESPKSVAKLLATDLAND